MPKWTRNQHDVYLHEVRVQGQVFMARTLIMRGLGSSVGIATGCELDGPGIETS